MQAPPAALFGSSPPVPATLAVARLVTPDPQVAVDALNAATGPGWAQCTSVVLWTASAGALQAFSVVSGAPGTENDPTAWGPLLDAERVVAQDDAGLVTLHIRHHGTTWSLTWAAVSSGDPAAALDGVAPPDATRRAPRPVQFFEDRLVSTHAEGAHLVYRTCWSRSPGGVGAQPWAPDSAWFAGVVEGGAR